MIRFDCDYAEGAHPAILQRLALTNLEQTPGYGEDAYCAQAADRIRDACGSKTAAVHFLIGGTQANTAVITAALRPHQGVLCADSGHIHVHETGGVEASGHKILPLTACNGKISAAQVDEACRAYWSDAGHEHVVQPGMVYISSPAENGMLYSLAELQALSAVCREWHLPLFLDGARLGYGLASPQNDVSIQDIAALCDVFTVGGTKVGALFGEAVVIVLPALQQDFRSIMKQRGAMLAKGRLLGLQFLTLFEDDLYGSIAAHAIGLAMRIRKAFLEQGCSFWCDSPTNQQFPILTDRQCAALAQHYSFPVWARLSEGRQAVRFCTSWATREEDVEALIRDIHRLPQA